VTGRADAAALDTEDPLRDLRDAFFIDDEDRIYLDGNSLGRLPHHTIEVLAAAVEGQWGRRLVGSWHEWIDLPRRVGERLASGFLGARPGQVVMGDSTTVNFYKLAAAALDARPDRHVIVTSADNFPTDRYVLEGLAAGRDLELRMIASDPVDGLGVDRLRASLDSDVALVSLSHVGYRSGALEPMAPICEAAREVGALTLWDLSHSVGSVPIDLDDAGADLAVGCTYKYLNGGPGGPAFLYVRTSLQDELLQPIWGWFGQRDQFAMGPSYDPEPGIGHFLSGTPPILGLLAVDAGVTVLLEAGVDRLRTKGVALTQLIIELADAWLEPHGVTLGSPRNPERRGSHISLRHPDAWRLCRALIEDAAVVPDFRAPDSIRLGPAPAYTRFVDVWDAMDRLRRLLEGGAYRRFEQTPVRVT
jgi:kynureninase